MKAENFRLRQYLDRIELAGDVTPDIQGVSRMMRHQLLTVPFENLDVQAGKIASLVPEHIVGKILPQRRGGLCYEVNGLFAMALDALGIPYQFVAARPMTYATQRPRTHIAILVTLNHEQWLCDLGFGSHCPRAPVSLNRVNQEITQDGDAFLLEKGEGREYVLKAKVGGKWASQYGFDRSPQEWIDFMPAHYFNSTHPDSIFVRKHFVVLYTEHGRNTLLGNMLKLGAHGQVEQHTVGPEHLTSVLERHFKLSL